MPGSSYLSSNRLTLRAVEPEDYTFICDHWNKPKFRHWFARHSPLTTSQISDVIEGNDEAVYFLPCRNSNPIGLLWLFNIDDISERAELGYWIISDEQNKGYATEAAELGVRYGFKERGLNKIMARVIEGNEPSQRVLEKTGFEKEGYLQEHYYVDGEYVDAHLFSILSDEWLADIDV